MGRGDEILDALYHGRGGDIVVHHSLEGWSVSFRDWAAADLGPDEALTILARLILGRTTAPLNWMKTAAELEERNRQYRQAVETIRATVAKEVAAAEVMFLRVLSVLAAQDDRDAVEVRGALQTWLQLRGLSAYAGEAAE